MAEQSYTRHGKGWRPSKPDHRDFRFAAHPRVMRSLPEKVDLRPLCPPIYDQGQLGSCTANAVGAAFQFDQIRQKLADTVPSRLFIYYNERMLEGTTNYDSGAEMRDAIKAVVKWGTCPEKDWDYIESMFAIKPPSRCYETALKNQGLTYSAVAQNLCTMQSVIASGFPFIVGFSVMESFESQEVADTGEVPMPSPGEAVLGGHAVVVVGYDNAERRFIMRNSWGTGWGNKGWFTFPYEFLLNSDYASDFWVLNTVETGI